VTRILKKYIDEFDAGRDLVRTDAEPFFDALIHETDEALLTSVFQTWNVKGIGEDEIYQIARMMRDRCTRVSSKHKVFVDVVGTGGSKSKTFNVSTAAAFVVAGAGVPVAKHGNRAATSSTGSADVLSALGVEPAVDPATAERCLNEVGICFMFAPNFHRLSPTLATVRRGLGFPTIFNCVGPLCNPAQAPHQLIGVWSRELVPKIANALARLGTKRSWVVHGSDGLDEISVSGSTYVAEVNDRVKEFEIEPSNFGASVRSADRIRVNTAEESAQIIRSVLESELVNDQRTRAEDIVIANAAAALHIAGRGDDLTDSARLAARSIADRHAMRKLDSLAAAVTPR